ncbi:MAG: CHASE2 domain-containing protein [Chitinophagaceae bacterium]|nr:CHASE2 domain-containing protein [Chitinophagaceae bacterium]
MSKKPLHKHIGHHAKKFHGHFTKYLYERDTILASLWVYIFIFGLSLIPLNLYVLNPIKQSLKDFDFTDMVYSKLGRGALVPIDSTITIVNIGNADRAGIAGLIEKVSAMEPKVIGVDVVFEGPRDSVADALLSGVISNTPNLVMANQVEYPTKKDKVVNNGFFDKASKEQGFVNMVTKDNQSIRQFLPFEKVGNKKYKSFAVAITEKFNAEAVKKLEKRHKEFELINYTRRLSRMGDDAVDADSKVKVKEHDQYQTIEPDMLMEDNVDPSAIKGRIVLLGYVNRDPNDILDKKFTPMNKRYAGKSTPDMNGIVVHANIISMILEENYVKKVPSWANLLISVVVCWLFMSFFIRYYLENHIWFHLVAKIIQVASAFLFAYLGIYLFDNYRIKVDMKMSLLVIIMAVDVIYFYEAWAVWMHKKFHYHTVFKPHHHG